MLIAELENGQTVAVIGANEAEASSNDWAIATGCLLVGLVGGEKLRREVRRKRKREDEAERDRLFEPDELPDLFNRIDGGEGVRRPNIAASRRSLPFESDDEYTNRGFDAGPSMASPSATAVLDSACTVKEAVSMSDSRTSTSRQTATRTRTRWTMPVLWLCAWLSLAGLFFWKHAEGKPAETGSPVVTVPTETPKYLTKQIRDIQPIVDRVLADNPEEDPDVLVLPAETDAELISELRGAEFADAIAQESAGDLLLTNRAPQADAEWTDFGPLDPLNWRIVEFWMRKSDERLLRIWLARPLWWLEEQRVQLQQTIELDLPEMGAQGPAQVVAVNPCPYPKKGPGRLVTGKFVHEAADVLDIHVAGRDEPIGTTTHHPFWSEDREAFVPAGELSIGENLRTYEGALTQVARIIPRAKPETVYNLEVDAEHVYHVSERGILVHNSYFGTPGFGTKIHQKFGRHMRALTNVRELTDRTKHGVNGVDISFKQTIRGLRNFQGKVQPGFRHAELKPKSWSGYFNFLRQLDNWRAKRKHRGNIALFMYDKAGKIEFIGVF